MMTLASFPAAEILPTALDQQPEHQRGFAHERELRNVDGVIRDQHRTEPVGEVSEPGDNEQHAEDLRHETGSVRQDAKQEQVGAEENQADMPERVLRINCAYCLVGIAQDAARHHELADRRQVDRRIGESKPGGHDREGWGSPE